MDNMKFRAWIYREKIMVPVERLYIPQNSTTMTIGACNEARTVGVNHIGYPKEIEIMQYTGINDKNGIEIFTKDIVKNHKNEIGEIKWMKEHCAFVIRTINPHKYNYIVSDGILNNIEVIGNIYENPELLESL